MLNIHFNNFINTFISVSFSNACLTHQNIYTHQKLSSENLHLVKIIHYTAFPNIFIVKWLVQPIQIFARFTIQAIQTLNFIFVSALNTVNCATITFVALDYF